ncbi:MAG: VOC family protein [Candidatus Thiodiazotropha sp. (ex Dulcina madagascariensis)]|nr:VOC family protein [Candidatus Thiodiazotropha sp. (ex Dulcina madagascariensis)]MCU7925056.1 VOC family protein [Candidatus Thiodiazotropha sp. (ex Dulcina madagascariensis)]
MTTSIWQQSQQSKPPVDSVVDFPTPSRFHVALNVVDVELVLPFYQTLFGKQPDTHSDGYAKFDLKEPPMLFSLNRVVHNAKGNGDFGVQLNNVHQIVEMSDRIKSAGMEVLEQDTIDDGTVRKLTVMDSEGNRWTLFVVLNAGTDEE